MCATVLGASLGYVSNSIVPLLVSTTTTGPAPDDGLAVCAAAGTAMTASANAAVANRIISGSSPLGSLQFLGSQRQSRNHRIAGTRAGRRSGPRSRDTG